MKEIRLLKASEIECRVGQCGKSQKGVGWCSLLLYKDARCDMKILDEVFGIFGWKKEYELINGGLFCTVSIKDPDSGEWISKQDIGTESNTEAKKGEASDAMKRSCVNIGIGRELYTAPKIFITLNENEVVERNGKVSLSPKCVFTVAEIDYDGDRNINALTIVDNSGVVRYRMGEVQKDKKDEVQNAASGGTTFEEQLEGYIKPSLEQARTESDVKKVWEEYSAYQSIPEFVSVITSRLNEIRSAA